jgi:hypothetical protein
MGRASSQAQFRSHSTVPLLGLGADKPRIYGVINDVVGLFHGNES